MAVGQIIIAALSGFIAVALGAFGAHGLKGRLDDTMLAAFQTGVQYQFYHTFAVLAVVLVAAHFPAVTAYKWAGWLFIVGMVLFSGSLYVMALSGVKIFGAITPIGGLCLLAGWLLFAAAGFKSI